jgi:hypothetical protein
MISRIALVLVPLIALSACGGVPQREGESKELTRYQPYAGAPIREFSTLRRVSGWNSVAPDKLVVWLGVNDAYLITVGTPCSNLEFENHIGFSSRTSTISTFDFVLLPRNERCPITEIRPIDYQRMKQDMRQKSEK